MNRSIQRCMTLGYFDHCFFSNVNKYLFLSKQASHRGQIKGARVIIPRAGFPQLTVYF